MYLIRNADVYAPEHLGKQDILICNDKIAAVCPFLRAESSRHQGDRCPGGKRRSPVLLTSTSI